MSDTPTSESESAFVCDCKESMRAACIGEHFYKEHEGKRYCVLHHPHVSKAPDFALALSNKLVAKDFNFHGIWFPREARFQGFHFDSTVNFGGAHFEGAADFRNCHFESDVNFSSALFNGDVCFHSAKFRSTDYDADRKSKPYERHKVDFSSATFKQKADFSSAELFIDGIAFDLAKFSGDADFSSAWLRGSHISSVIGFHSAVFEQSANFNHSEIDSANFTFASFSGEANFQSANFHGPKDPDFSRAKFQKDSDFSFAKFSYHRVKFISVVFSGDVNFQAATFEGGADFAGVTFNGSVDFSSSHFKDHGLFTSAPSVRDNAFVPTSFLKGANFDEAFFDKNADFRGAMFYRGVHFRGAEFLGDADFSDATFNSDLDLASSTVGSYLRFSGENNQHTFNEVSVLNLEHAVIKKPEHISFHALQLRPNWFINIDAHKFELIEIDWGKRSVTHEIASLFERGKMYPYRPLSIAYRGLAVNAEENHRYEEASKFRYMAMEARRLESWRGFAFWRLSWWFWLASGYSERVLQAFLVLLGIWLVAASLYARVGFARWEPRLATEAEVAVGKRDEVGVPLKFSRALTYSAGVMTLQKPEPRPATTAAQTIVLLETVLGPVQAALLALAIRRKFMR
jgi:uncharacterized protein YjbI with pentapeptide repeats